MKKGEAEKSEKQLFEELKEMFEAFDKRKKYTELSADILKTIPDEKLVRAIVDFVATSIKDDFENDATKVPPLGPGFSAVYFLHKLDVEVNNGGFNQFMFNDGRRAVELAKEGAEFVGMKELAAVVSKALQIEEREREKLERVKNQGTLDAFMESYSEISFDVADDAFVELNLDFERELVKSIRSRPELFVGKVP